MTWCFHPETDCPSAQEAVALIWASTSQSRNFTPGALLSGMSIPERQLLPRNAPDIFNLRPSGMMCAVSMQGHSPAHSTLCLLDTPAKGKAMLENDLAKRMSDGFGMISSGSFRNLGLPCGGVSLRTFPAILPAASKPCCVPFIEWVSGLRLAYSRRKKSARRMKDKGSLLWPTATARMANGPAHKGREGGLNLQTMVQIWGTPSASQANYDEAPQSFLERSRRLVAMGRPPPGVNLGQQAQTWPTPSAMQDTKGDADIGAIQRRMRLGKQIALSHRARLFSRPRQTTNQPGKTPLLTARILRPLFRLMKSCASPAGYAAILRGHSKSKLNPQFAEWLMGWPSGHALCDCSETEWSLWKLHMRGALLALPTVSAGWIWEAPKARDKPVQLTMFDEI